MNTICAWCKKKMGHQSDETGGEDLVSHGICPDCQQFFFYKKEGLKLQHLLDDFQTPVIVIDGDGLVQYGNRSALQLLGKNLDVIQNIPGGNVFECAYSRLPEGCGKTVHCSGCTIRNTVMGNLASGENRHAISVSLFREFGTEIRPVPITISTERIGDVVVLRFDVPA